MKKCEGDYIYLGLLYAIRRIISEIQVTIVDQKINSTVNVDGGPLHK